MPNTVDLINGKSIELDFRQEFYDKKNRTILISSTLSDGIVPDAVILKSIYTGSKKIFWIKDTHTINLIPPLQIGNYINHDMKIDLQIQFNT